MYGVTIDAKVNGRAFLRLNENTMKRLSVSIGFELLLLSIIDELVCSHSFIKTIYACDIIDILLSLQQSWSPSL